MDDIFVTQPFTARHVRFTKKLGFGSLGMLLCVKLMKIMENTHLYPNQA